MKKYVFSRIMCIAAALCIALVCIPTAVMGETLQDCHRVKLAKKDTTQSNGSVIRLWRADTALDSVTDEINSIAQSYADKYAPLLKSAGNKTSKNSRVDVEIRYSRTGLTWLSFMVQARVTYHRSLTEQEFTAITYDMTTGEKITLSDIFGEDSVGWGILQQNVEKQITSYYGEDNKPDAAALKSAEENIADAPFTLHGMSLVLHYPAAEFYPGKNTLLEVTIMYPDIWDSMTDKAYAETDNLAYYNTCALTFDDGPQRTYSSQVLNSLMETGSRATFFVIGNQMQGELADLVQREHDEGHSIGTHNWTHGDARKISTATLQQMPGKCNKAMMEVIGMIPKYDRVPYGVWPNMVKSKVGWPLIQWSVDTYDWRGRSTVTVLGTVKKQISDGDIILCHDVKEHTPESARQICNYLAENGYIMLTIDELFAKDNVELEPDTVYYRCVDGDYSIKPGSK